MSNEIGIDFSAALAKDNAKTPEVATGPNDSAANWIGAFGVPFAGKGDGLTFAERAVRGRGPEGQALHPLPTDVVAPIAAPDVEPSAE